MARLALTESGSLGRNVAFAVLAQGVSFISSLMMSVVVPKILGLEDYAYWQLFSLYVGYVGLALLGTHDGVFLRLGGVAARDIDWPRIKTQFLIIAAFQLAAAAVAAVGIVSAGGLEVRSVVLLLVVADGLIVNPAAFLFYVLRAANLPNIYSVASMLSGSLWAVLLVLATIARPDGFLLYAIGYLSCQLVSSAYCYLHFREVFRCRCSPARLALADTARDCVAGLKVTVAYYAGSLIVGFCRMVVDFRWGLAAFGKFSFSVSIVNFLLTFMAQVSMVIFPVIRRMGGDGQERVYGLLRSALVTVLPVVYLLYYPGCALLGWWLPQYSESLRYLAIILPVCIFDCKMQLLVNTYLKLLRKETVLLWINVFALVASVVMTLSAAFLISDVDATAIAMVCAVALRSVVAECCLGRFVSVGSPGVLVCEVVLACWFVFAAYVASSPLLTAAGVLVFYALNYRSVLRFARSVLFRKKR